MNYYIQTTDPLGKAEYLANKHEAKLYPWPWAWEAIPADKALICVVEDGAFQAAVLCYSEQELRSFAQEDGRRKVWVLMDKITAHKLAGYNE